MWELVGKVLLSFILLRVLWSIFKLIYGSFLGSLMGQNSRLEKMGKWAVITGSTDGIGKAFAFELASKGMNIVLISRSPFKLQNTSAEITKKYPVDTKIIDVDFTKNDIYDRIAKETSGLEIGVLINNVGMSYEFPKFFWELEDEFLSNLVNCNIQSVTKMCSVILPGMLERKKGAIINISSLSSIAPSPLLTVYAATKSFITSFSEHLALEVKSKGVVVQCLAPGFVVSNMSKLRKPTLTAPLPSVYVRQSLRTTGIEHFSGGCLAHKLLMSGIEVAKRYFPKQLLDNLLYSMYNGLRTRGLKKKEREAKAN